MVFATTIGTRPERASYKTTQARVPVPLNSLAAIRGWPLSSPIRRVVTGKDAAGKAIAIIDGPATSIHRRAELGLTNTLLWVTDSVPADLANKEDAANRKVGIAPPPGGTIFRAVESAPSKGCHGRLRSQADNRSGTRPRTGRCVPRKTARSRDASHQNDRLRRDHIWRD